ncbi:putative protein N(5)-glutamine methyltransferase [Frigoribacterium sp. 2-23]|uniref:putative protein N(5)-glutamine methyltransferase n=1 Tax=Frigoribacterium sp. 2-23 TaxID=3415006 RepID=UPI003C6F3D3B
MPVADPALVARLRAAGCVFAEDEAAVIDEEARRRHLSAPAREALVARRETGEPLEQVVGWVRFAGRRLAVAPGVFVPRRRTELLVREAAALLHPGAVVVELCCGVAAVAVSLLVLEPGLEVWASDIDPRAVAVARANLSAVDPGLPGDRVVGGDLYGGLPSALRGRVDVLVANAPYVPTEDIATMPPEARDHEPRGALDGGADGLDLQGRVAGAAASWLRPGGRLLIETSERQAPSTRALIESAGLAAHVVRDDDLDATAVVGRASL